MKVTYRQGRKEDSLKIAELDYIASAGAAEFLFHDLVPDSTPTQVIANELENDFYPHTYRNAIVAESNNQVVGMALSFPSEFHCITNQMKDFFPPERLEHFNEFFSTRVEGSYLLDTIAVEEEFRSQGIGQQLLEHTIQKAKNEGYLVLSLLVFADNIKGIKFYEQNGFRIVKNVELEYHELIPHEGGCLLMSKQI